jgi:hypothetical protein
VRRGRYDQRAYSRAAPAFHPISLFGAGEVGYIFDPLTGTIYTDTTGNTPATTGQQVLRLASQDPVPRVLTNSIGPTRRVDGLEFDGTDDALALTFTFNQPITRISAIRQKSWTANDQIYCGGSANSCVLLQVGISPNIGIYDGSAVIGALPATLNTWFVVTEFHSGAASSVQLNNVAATTGDPGSVAAGGLTLGKRTGVETYANFDMGRCVGINRALTGPETTAVKNWCGSPVGISL